MAGLALCGLAFAAEPAPFVADIQARPIDEPDAVASNAPLRWKAKRLPAANENFVAAIPARPIGEESPPPRAGWNITRIDPSVRPAQAVSSDPFTDPFGDRKAGHDSGLILQPTEAESSIETLPPPRATTAIRRTTPSPQLTSAQPDAAAPGALPAPGAGPMPLAPGIPCERVYNDRDCCDAETNCRDFRNRLSADSIRDISLDITPRYNPSLTLEEDVAERADKLRLLELRQWRDRRGEVRANGKMTNLENGSVVITDETGREVARIGMHELGDDELCYVNAWWELPIECPLGGFQPSDRNWIPSTFAWHASALCHKPLYFEQVQLERYGHTAGPIRQPLISGAHFFVSLAALPYKMAINPPHECQYALGYYRPGSCAPWMIPPIPLSVRGALAEAGAILGGVHLIP